MLYSIDEALKLTGGKNYLELISPEVTVTDGFVVFANSPVEVTILASVKLKLPRGFRRLLALPPLRAEIWCLKGARRLLMKLSLCKFPLALALEPTSSMTRAVVETLNSSRRIPI